jgi:hypothetical protein
MAGLYEREDSWELFKIFTVFLLKIFYILNFSEMSSFLLFAAPHWQMFHRVINNFWPRTRRYRNHSIFLRNYILIDFWKIAENRLSQKVLAYLCVNCKRYFASWLPRTVDSFFYILLSYCQKVLYSPYEIFARGFPKNDAMWQPLQ